MWSGIGEGSKSNTVLGKFVFKAGCAEHAQGSWKDSDCKSLPHCFSPFAPAKRDQCVRGGFESLRLDQERLHVAEHSHKATSFGPHCKGRNREHVGGQNWRVVRVMLQLPHRLESLASLQQPLGTGTSLAANAAQDQECKGSLKPPVSLPSLGTGVMCNEPLRGLEDCHPVLQVCPRL